MSAKELSVKVLIFGIFLPIFEKIGFLGTVLIIYFVILMSSLLWNPKFIDAALGLPWVYLIRALVWLVLLPIGFIVLVVGIIGTISYTPGAVYDKWYVVAYAIICCIWESLVGFATFVGIDTFTEPMEILEFSIYFIPPLIPLWYLRRKSELWVAYEIMKRRRERSAKGPSHFAEYKPKSINQEFGGEPEDQLEDLKERLNTGIITQEEYERKKRSIEKSFEIWDKAVHGKEISASVVIQKARKIGIETEGKTLEKILEEMNKKKEKQEALAWELKDQLKGLKEQLDRGHITQEDYEQKKKKLLEES